MAPTRVKIAYLHIKCLLDNLFFLLQPPYIHGGFLLNHSSFLSCLITTVTSVAMWSICFLRQDYDEPREPPLQCGHFCGVRSSHPEVAFCPLGKYAACMMWCHFMQKSVTHCPCVLWHHLLLLCIYFVINAGCFPIASGHNDCCNLLSAKSDTICRQKHIIVYIIFK